MSTSATARTRAAKLVAWLTIPTVLLALLVGFSGFLLVAGAATGDDSDSTPAGCNDSASTAVSTGASSSVAGVNAEQAANAQTIVDVGAELAVPTYGQIIAIATALGESGLRNLDHGDRDSLGLFQQRPSQGWGTPEQILDPHYAATQFYEHLLAVPGWDSMPVTVAAQSVQRSAVPDGYARQETLARQLVTALTGITATSTCTAVGPVVMIGDSITVAATPKLHELIPDIDIDAEVGRRLDQGLDRLAGHDLAGATLVIALCTNPTAGDFATELDQTMTTAAGAGARSVVWVTCTEWNDAVPGYNAAIRAAADRYPNVTVAEWANVSRTAGYLGPDGIHPTSSGVDAHASLIATSIPTAIAPAPPGVGVDGYALPLPASAIKLPLGEHHDGGTAVDIPAATGTPIYAITAGTVTYTTEGNACGLGMIVTDPTGTTWTYCHASERLTADGSTVAAGQRIALVGSTGESTGPHLHLEIHDAAGRGRCSQPFVTALVSRQVVPGVGMLSTSSPCAVR